MNRRYGFAYSVLLLGILGLVSCKPEKQPIALPAPAAPTDKPIQIPKVSVSPNAPDDWTKQAHQVCILTRIDSTPGAKAQLAVAWTPAALLLQVRTDDTTPFEEKNHIFNGDSVELFVASSPDSDDRLHITFCPGRMTDPPAPSWHVYDTRNSAPAFVDPEVHTQKDANGYVMTLSVPWTNLNHVPQPGDVIGLQVHVNDLQTGGRLSHSVWFPKYMKHQDGMPMQRVQLANQADPPEIVSAQFKTKGLRNLAVEVNATADYVGKNVAVWLAGKQIAGGNLTAGGLDGSSAEILVPADSVLKDAAMIVTVDDRVVPAPLKVPDLAKYRLDFFKSLPLAVNPSIFGGAFFPKIDFVNRELVEEAFGSCSLHIRFFDRNWNEVTAPQAPGRYGALVECKSEEGLTNTRHLTLFKTAHPYFPAKDPYDVIVRFPAAFGMPPETVSKEDWNISNWVGGTLEAADRHDDKWAVLLAGLADIAQDSSRWHGFSAWDIDDAWWAELGRRQGEDQDYPHLTRLPDGYDKDKRAWSLILFLHGSGQRGHDLNRLKNEGPLGYINKGHPLPFIVVVPQCPEGEWWDPVRLMRLIDQVETSNRVDSKQIYVTGLSMGGYGTFALAATYPDKFAAIAPIAGAANPENAERIRKIPIWIFHGSEDDVVPTRFSIDMAHALQKLNASVKLTIYQGVGHGGWDESYADPKLYAWFLEHSK